MHVEAHAPYTPPSGSATQFDGTVTHRHGHLPLHRLRGQHQEMGAELCSDAACPLSPGSYHARGYGGEGYAYKMIGDAFQVAFDAQRALQSENGSRVGLGAIVRSKMGTRATVRRHMRMEWGRVR